MVNGIASAVTDNIAITSISDGTIVPIISITDGVTGISSDGIGITTTAGNNALTISNSVLQLDFMLKMNGLSPILPLPCL